MMGRDGEGSDDPYPDEYNGPRAEVRSVDIPDSSSSDVPDSSLTTLFVFHVVIWNAVLLSFSLGLMFIYFEQNWRGGGQLVGASVVLALYGAYRWPDGVDWSW